MARDRDVITSPYETLLVSVARPSPLNELQHRMFMDFTFQWRYYIDDPMIWEHPSPLFSTLMISLLRLAAWDFEVTFDTPVELPIGVTAVPRWKAPETDIFWFHGFLVVQRRNLDTVSSIISAISRATEFLGDSRKARRKTRLILTSLHHVVLVEISPESTLCSSAFPLLLNTSARQCSPGFRVLSQAFTSSSWKQEIAEGETWALNLPPELLQMVLITAEPKAVLSFGQASFLGELWYYSTIPQLGDIKALSFDVSILCCGRNTTKAKGVFCRKCFVWQHVECLHLTDVAIEDSYLCLDCESGKTCWDLDIGAIGSANRRQDRDAGCLINLAGTPKTLDLRLLQPSHLRPEIRYMGNLATMPPRLVNYTIRFNGEFSGLAYGLEDGVVNLSPK